MPKNLAESHKLLNYVRGKEDTLSFPLNKAEKTELGVMLAEIQRIMQPSGGSSRKS